MKVILLEDVEKFGKKNEVVDAKSGYARNFLIPQKLAVEATKKNLKLLAEQQANAAEEAAYQLAQAEGIAETLNDQIVVIQAKAGEGGKLFGTITNKEVADAIKEKFNIEIDRRKIILDDKIKTLGTFGATIRLHPEVKTDVRVQVKE